MKRSLLICVLGLLLAAPLCGQSTFGQIRKDRLFKVDPMGGMFHELRVVIENRFKKELWWFVSPHGYQDNWLPRTNDRRNRPDNPQKYYGLGLRAGARNYFGGKSPMGLYFSAHAAYRRMWVNQYNDGLSLERRDKYSMWGGGAAVGWQGLYGAKDNIAYGGLIGLEYFRGFGQSYQPDSLVQYWYEFPFVRNSSLLNGFRLYIGIELGFAFKQKRLHW